MKPYVVHLTPALLNNKKVASNNLGDLIIAESVKKVLIELFKDTEIIDISTHDFPEPEHIRLIQHSQYTFIGGSNLLSSNIKIYNQWKYSTNRWRYFFPDIKNIHLMGVGWWQYQHKPTWRTAHFYKKVFSGKNYLSVRDNYTKKQLIACGLKNVINTSCPTTWELNGVKTNKTNNVSSCIFALTDYNPDVLSDNELIGELLKSYEQLFFFPQGTDDIELLNTLPNYTSNKSRIFILERTIESFRNFLLENKDTVNYIGTRLHLGIFCIQHGIPALIISIDNRAIEISLDIRLPVIRRGDFLLLREWINNSAPEDSIQLHLEEINRWKQQYNQSI